MYPACYTGAATKRQRNETRGAIRLRACMSSRPLCVLWGTDGASAGLGAWRSGQRRSMQVGSIGRDRTRKREPLTGGTALQGEPTYPRHGAANLRHSVADRGMGRAIGHPLAKAQSIRGRRERSSPACLPRVRPSVQTLQAHPGRSADVKHRNEVTASLDSPDACVYSAPMAHKFYTAQVVVRVRTADGDVEDKTFEQDVTDDFNDGADHEELVDRVYWKQIAGKYDTVCFLSGNIIEE